MSTNPSTRRDGKSNSHENNNSHLEEQANTIAAYFNTLQDQSSRLLSPHQLNNNSVPSYGNNAANQQNMTSMNLSMPFFGVGDVTHPHHPQQPNPSASYLAPLLGVPFQQQAGLNSNPFLLPQIVNNPSVLINNPLLSHQPPSNAPLIPIATSATEAHQPATVPSPLSRPPVVPANTPFFSSFLYIQQQDDECLSKYQCTVRRQIEVFEATESDLTEKSQGRNTPIILRQIGIRCKHCGKLDTKERGKGAKFFPSQQDGLYQTAQNLANKHLLHHCKEIPPSIREDLARIREKERGSSQTRKSAHGLGRRYWSECLRSIGIVPIDRRLFLVRENNNNNNNNTVSSSAAS